MFFCENMTPFVSYNLFICQKVNILVACCFLYYSWHYIILQNIQSCILKGCKVTNPKESCTTTTTFRLSKIPSGASIITATGPIVFQFADLLRNFFVSLWWPPLFHHPVGFSLPSQVDQCWKKSIVTISKNAKAQGPFETSFEYKKIREVGSPNKIHFKRTKKYCRYSTAEPGRSFGKENAIQVAEGCISQLNCISLNAKKRRSMFFGACWCVAKKKHKLKTWCCSKTTVFEVPKLQTSCVRCDSSQCRRKTNGGATCYINCCTKMI